MAKNAANDFTHTVVRDADYYRRVPKEGDQPQGVFVARTRVRLLNEKQGYAHVRSDRVTGWVSKEHLKPSQPPLPVQNGKIAFQSYRDGSSEIYTMNADGSNQTNISNNVADEALPAWSPGGTKIAFQSYRDGNWQIYTMNADGTHQMRLTNNSVHDEDPHWSPDGMRIAFRRNDPPDIFVMNADGSGQTNISNIRAANVGLAWSPDGTKIASDFGTAIYVMNADGSAQRPGLCPVKCVSLVVQSQTFLLPNLPSALAARL